MDTFENVTSNANDMSVLEKVGNLGNAGAHANAHANIDKVSGVARTAVDSLAAGAHQGFDKATDVASQAVETFDMKREQLKVAQAKLIEGCQSYVQKNPLTSLGIATAVGYVVSRLLNSRRH